MPKITVIPATRDIHTGAVKDTLKKKRVAGYARVSTNHEEQVTSYEAQVDYYTKYIKGRPDWEFLDVYTDEGISATNTKHRDGFNKMIRDALDGKIDLIITKSVSRFARNTVDSLTTVSKLKEKGVEVYFEKENIYTLDSKGELLITIMSSLAQEESRSISENITWGKRKYFADGKVYLPYGRFLGYRKGADGLPEIVEEEAEINRFIYRSYLEGKTTYTIAQELTDKGIPTPSKKLVKWAATTIESILKNEKYKGSALLQKEFTVDFLTKRTKKNEGEISQYYIENSHPAIISPSEFEMVQAEIRRRRGLGKTYSGNTVFASKIIYGDCGRYYGPKVWHSTDKYRKVIYRCNAKYKEGELKCKTPTITEEDIKSAFIKAFNTLMENKEQLLDDCRYIQSTLCDTTLIDVQLKIAIEEMQVVKELLLKCISDNSKVEQGQEEFWGKYNTLEQRYEKAKSAVEGLQNEKQARSHKAETIGAFIFELHERDGVIKTFDERLWISSVKDVIIMHSGRMLFTFKNGMRLEV